MKSLWIGLLVILVIGGGYLFYRSQANSNSSNDATEQSNPQSSAPDIPDTMSTEAEMTDTDSTDESSGQKLGLVGSLATNYYVHTAENYDKVVNSGQPYYLNFYANWCPTCAAQAEVDLPLFDELGPANNLIALRVNTLDSDTDSDEEALAKQYGVRYQHTLIIFNGNGEEIERFLGQTSAEQLRQAFEQARNS